MMAEENALVDDFASTDTELEEAGKKKTTSTTRDDVELVASAADDGLEEHKVMQLEPRKHVKLVLSYGFNLANATIGAGVLGLPYVMKECGVIFTLLLFILGALLSDYTLILLARCFYLANGEDQAYEAVGARCYGRWGIATVAFGTFVLNFGALVAYEIIVGDLLQPLVVHYITAHPVWSHRALVSAFFVFLVMLPLSMYRRIGDLWITSVLSISFVGVFSVIVIVKSIMVGFNQTPLLFRISTDFFSVFGIVLFAFAAHTNVYPQTKEDRNLEWQKCIPPAMHVSVSTSVVAYSVIAFFGYMTFFEATPGNLLMGYEPGNVLTDIPQFLLAVTILLTAPLAAFPARASFDYVAFGGEANPRRESLRFYLEIGFLYGISFGLAILFRTITVVFNFTGAVGSSLTSLIFPALFYLKLKGPPISRQTFLRVLPFLAIIALGCVSMVIGIVVHLIEMITQ